MNKFNFQQTGGFPFDTDVLHDMQEAYTIFNSLGAIAGDKTIISGCIENGNNVSDGYIYVHGELFRFVGGSKAATIVLVEQDVNVEFEDGVLKTILKKRHYQFGTGIDTLNWIDFKRFDILSNLTERLEQLEGKQNIEIIQSGTWVNSQEQTESGLATIMHPLISNIEDTKLMYVIRQDNAELSPLSAGPGHMLWDRSEGMFRISYNNFPTNFGQISVKMIVDWWIVKK